MFDPTKTIWRSSWMWLRPSIQGLRREACVNGTCPPAAEIGLMHGLHFQDKYAEPVSEISMLQNQKGLKAKQWEVLGTGLKGRAVQYCPVATPWRWPKPPQHGLEPRGFWRGDQDVAHAQWEASLLLHGGELHVYPETCQDINEDIRKLMLLRKHVLSKVRSLEESPQLAATWSQTLSRTECAWMELN